MIGLFTVLIEVGLMSIYGPIENDFMVWENSKGRVISQNFHLHEFECDMGKWSMISLVLVDKLQEIRDEVGFPLKINSAFRSAEKQQVLKDSGFKTAKGISQHELGRAVDIDMTHLDPRNRQILIDAITKRFMSVGIAKNFIHVDLRDDRPRTWSY